MPRQRTTLMKPLSDSALADALARTPADQHVVWNGRPCPQQPGSIRSLALGLVAEVWEPVPMRILVRRAARIAGASGLDPNAVRNAVRMHQSAGSAAYFLVRRTLAGDYVAVTDIPFPSCGGGPVREGEVVLSRSGARLDGGRFAHAPRPGAVPAQAARPV